MKSFIRPTIPLLIILTLFFSCNKINDDTPTPPAPPPQPTPSLTVDKSIINSSSNVIKDSIVVTSTEPWTISIPSTGSWLMADKTTGIAGTTKVYLTFSPNITSYPRTSAITVTSNGATLSPVTVNVTQEQADVKIAQFTPPHAPGGAIITINGSGFSAILNENVVKINGVNAIVNTANTGSLTVTVPMGAGSGPIQVIVNSKSDTSISDFIYDWIGTVTIVAGGTQGYSDGVGISAQLNHPAGLDIDASNNLYVADYANYKVRKITPDGLVTTLPGRFPSWTNPSGPNTDFGLPQDVAVDGTGNIYVAEVNSSAISKISPDGIVSMLAGGSASNYADGIGLAAQFYWPTGIEVDAIGNLIVADNRNHRIRKINPSGLVTTLAGSIQSYADGIGASAYFNMPFSVTMDIQGNFLLSDFYNNRIRKMTPTGIVTTVAGNGGAATIDGDLLAASIYQPTDIAIDPTGNIYLCDGNAKIRWITPSGKVRTINTNIAFSTLQGITVDHNGALYVSDYYNNRICKITIQ